MQKPYGENFTDIKWSLTTDEKAIIKQLEEKGFIITIKKQTISKTVFSAFKDGLSDDLEVPCVKNGQLVIADMVAQFERNFERLKELTELRQIAKEQGLI